MKKKYNLFFYFVFVLTVFCQLINADNNKKNYIIDDIKLGEIDTLKISFSNLSNINQINWDDLNLFFKNKDIEITQIKEPGFLINVTLASIFQVIFTFVLLYLFRFSNFVVGTSLSKTEVVQVAIFEYLILNEKLSKLGISGIIISTLGVIILSIKVAS